MAEKTEMQVLANWMNTNTNIVAQIGANTYLGISRKERDLLRRLESGDGLISLARMPYGRSIYGKRLGRTFFVMEACHKSDLSRAQEIYRVAWEALVKERKQGTTFSMAIEDFIAPEDDTLWENKAICVRGVLKMIWIMKT